MHGVVSESKYSTYATQPLTIFDSVNSCDSTEIVVLSDCGFEDEELCEEIRSLQKMVVVVRRFAGSYRSSRHHNLRDGLRRLNGVRTVISQLEVRNTNRFFMLPTCWGIHSLATTALTFAF